MLGPQHLLPGDLVDVVDKGPPLDAPDYEQWAKQNGGQPVRNRWHAVDAKHALMVEPERYELVEYPVAAIPHTPGYSAVTPHMAAHGFSAPLREAGPAEPEPHLHLVEDDDDGK